MRARDAAAARARAGGGDEEQAACECCGKFLGCYGGRVRPRVSREPGSGRNPVDGGAADAVLLCGSRYEGCYGLCEDRDPGMEAAGFWIGDGNGYGCDPRLVPLLVRTRGGETAARWLTGDGGKSWERPEAAA